MTLGCLGSPRRPPSRSKTEGVSKRRRRRIARSSSTDLVEARDLGSRIFPLQISELSLHVSQFLTLGRKRERESARARDGKGKGKGIRGAHREGVPGPRTAENSPSTEITWSRPVKIASGRRFSSVSVSPSAPPGGVLGGRSTRDHEYAGMIR